MGQGSSYNFQLSEIHFFSNHAQHFICGKGSYPESFGTYAEAGEIALCCR